MKHIYLIGEVGINHNGHLDHALRLCQIAKDAGCDAVKFQKRTVEFTPAHMQNQLREWEGETITYLDYRRKVEFGRDEYDEIDRFCREIDLPWSASAWDIPSLEFISKYDLPWVKIPSAKLTDLDLISTATEHFDSVIVSTGMSTFEEIVLMTPLIQDNPRNMLMHCHSAYPAPDEELALPLIPKYEELFGMRIGYSSHSTSYYPALYAAVLGAKAIEVHITLDRSMEGSDHAASLEPGGLARLRRELDRIPLVLAQSDKRVWDSELPARHKLRGV